MEGKFIKLYDENDEEIDCEIVMSYFCEENGKDYVFYTDNRYDTDGNLNLYASRYLGVEDDEIKVGDVESEEEWALLDEALEEAKRGLGE